MPRPGSTSRRRVRDEEDDASSRRGGRGGAPAKKGIPPAQIALGVGVAVAVLLLIFMLTQGEEKKPERRPVLGPPPVKKAEPPPPAPVLPTKVPPKPLTPAERAEIDALFTQAQPHADALKRLAKEGWDLKGKGDNEGANAVWVKAKKEGRQALAIVNEVLENDQYPAERQDAFMGSWLSRYNAWVKEMGNIPKVHEE